MGIKFSRVLGFAVLISMPAVAADRVSDQQIKQAIIQESLASYPGNCPCPYNVDRRGRSCGRRSAYSKPGGYAPICYVGQVTVDMVHIYREGHK
jgi:hypothetical protein